MAASFLAPSISTIPSVGISLAEFRELTARVPSNLSPDPADRKAIGAETIREYLGTGPTRIASRASTPPTVSPDDFPGQAKN